jgi:pyrimidine operon attenuation protein/uracil phosphoribosyltransferase
MTEQKIISLSRGELTLRYQTTADYQLDDLLGFAERINPKRAFLFVSKVLGRHIPVSPDKMRQAFTQLATLIPDDLPEPIVVIGMAETAVGLSAGVHQVLQARYPQAILLNSTRHAQAGELFTTFSEDHSHASVHLIYQSDDSTLQANVENAKTLIMVDDEASTGNTCQNVVNALLQAGMNKLEQVLSLRHI